MTLNLVYGYAVNRPEMCVQFIPPKPPTKFEIVQAAVMKGAIASVICTIAISAFLHNPILFAGCFFMGFAQGMMQMAMSRNKS